MPRLRPRCQRQPMFPRLRRQHMAWRTRFPSQRKLDPPQVAQPSEPNPKSSTAEEFDSGRRRVACPQQHMLMPRIETTGCTCDHCNSDLGPTSVMSCVPCNFDLCFSCCDAIVTETKARAERGERDSETSSSDSDSDASDNDPEAEDEPYPHALHFIEWQLSKGNNGMLHLKGIDGLACGRHLHSPEEGTSVSWASQTGRRWSPRCWLALPTSARDWWRDGSFE